MAQSNQMNPCDKFTDIDTTDGQATDGQWTMDEFNFMRSADVVKQNYKSR